MGLRQPELDSARSQCFSPPTISRCQVWRILVFVCLGYALFASLHRWSVPHTHKHHEPGTSGGSFLPIEPLAPFWPRKFQVDFIEASYIGWLSLTTTGTYYYDWAKNRSRIDRANGKGDRYCGSALPLRDTPCTHLIRDNMRLLIFPEHNYCCKCCSSSSGCGPVKPDWLTNATYQGQDTIFGTTCNKWNQNIDFQNNYYWHSLDNVPMRIYQEFTDQIDFVKETYTTTPELEDSLFEYPSNMDCSLNCYGVCAIVATRDGHQSSHKEAKSETNMRPIS